MFLTAFRRFAMSRSALLSSAVSFLRDPATANSPLAQRVAFLESKGLTPQEVEAALATAAAPAYNGSGGPYNSPQQFRGQRREFERDWRDWFIMSVVGGTVAYLAVGLAKVSLHPRRAFLPAKLIHLNEQRYIIPHLQSPDQTQLLASQTALEAKYDEAAALLLDLQTSTDTLVTSLEEQKVQLDQELLHLRTAVDESREAERKREIWAKGVTEKVDQVVSGLPKVRSHLVVLFVFVLMVRRQMLEKQSTMQSQSLVDLSTELKSLKSLLLTRRPTTTAPLPTAPIPTLPTSYSTSALPSPSAPSVSPLPTSATSSDIASTTTTLPPAAPTRVSSFGVRPAGIPAWQLKGNGAGLASSSNSNTVVPPPVATPIPIVTPTPATPLNATTTSFTPTAPTNGEEVAKEETKVV